MKGTIRMEKLTYMEQLISLTHNPLTLVFLLAVIDIATGLIKAKINKQYQSNIFKKGLITHTLIILGLFLFDYYAGDYNISPLVAPIATAFAGMYISSIYENYKEMGGSIPPKATAIIDTAIGTLENEVKSNESGNSGNNQPIEPSSIVNESATNAIASSSASADTAESSLESTNSAESMVGNLQSTASLSISDSAESSTASTEPIIGGRG